MVSRLVLLDDDIDVLDALSDLFAALGATTVAVDSVAALKGRRQEVLTCGLALLDLQLGQGKPTGLDALDWLRAEGFAGRVVLITGHGAGHPLVEQACARAGAQLLSKPVGLSELRALLAL